jgi:hypothetical protein
MFFSHLLLSPILHCHIHSLIYLNFQHFFTSVIFFPCSSSMVFHSSSENVHKQCMKIQGKSYLTGVHNALMCAGISHERWPNQSTNLLIATLSSLHLFCVLSYSFLSLLLLSNCLCIPTLVLPR